MMTINDLQIAFKKLNSMYFENSLPMVTIKHCNSSSYMGLFYRSKDKYNRHIIKINKRYEMSDHETENILVHEMIHLWQFINGYTDSHGASFNKKMHDINRIGNHKITPTCAERFKISSHAIKTIKPSYILVYTGKSGIKYVYKFTNPDKLKEGCRHLLRYSPNGDISNFNAYSAVNQTVIEMRASVKRLWRYDMNDATVNNIISAPGTKAIKLAA